ncbi:MAG: hypothetical protein JKY33_02445 [Bacteroidia bacterium]|nr:hypothetical protein [Bacteroidia bacterium]MBL4715900.1 hypothetical protein [Bacteroidia bacterium]
MTLLSSKYHKYWWIIVLVLCIASRLLTTIYYIEDPDSLRFALATQEYDLQKLQPHFPGYPVFCFIVNVIYAVCGKFSISFSIIGGLATFLLMCSARSILNSIYPQAKLWILDVLIFFNPMIWLMGNRYMSDILGLAAIMVGLLFFVKYIKSKCITDIVLFGLITGLAFGVRLSFIPFLFIPAIYITIIDKRRWSFLLSLIMGGLIWIIPFVFIMGLDGILDSAAKQSTGHFGEWGGTIITENAYWLRLKYLFQGIWAHGLGGYDGGRHWLTLLVSGGLVFSIFGFIKAKNIGHDHKKIIQIIVASTLLYLLWIYFFQNIMYKPRHVLPVVAVILMIITVGLSKHMSSNLRKGIAAIFLISYSVVGIVIAKQHQNPSAISQALSYLKGQDNTKTVVSIPLVNQYFGKQALKVELVDVETDAEFESVINRYESFYYVGKSIPEFDIEIVHANTFYHNPYVNNLWPSVKVYELARR